MEAKPVSSKLIMAAIFAVLKASKDGIFGIMSKPLVDLLAACKPLALTAAAKVPWLQNTAVSQLGTGHDMKHIG